MSSKHLKEPLLSNELMTDNAPVTSSSSVSSHQTLHSNSTAVRMRESGSFISTSALSASVFELDLKKDYFKITIVTSGSRGDVQPYIALALFLQAQGHIVTVATERRMQGLVEEFLLPYQPIEGDPTGVLFEPKAQQVLQNGSMMKLIKLTEEWDKKFKKEDIYNSYLTACEGSNMIIASPLVMTGTYCVAEYLGVKWVPLILGPTMPTNEFPIWPLKNLILCSCLNKWSYNLAFKMLWNSEAKTINPWREQKLGLPPITAKRGIADILDRTSPPIIIACSRLLCGKRGVVPSDYPANVNLVGFYFVPPSNDSDISEQSVLDFFHQTSSMKTIYLGFGSMPAPNPLALIQLVVSITKNLHNARTVLVAGWSALDTDEARNITKDLIEEGKLLVAKAIPHDWLFPKVDCIVHHCGVSSHAV